MRELFAVALAEDGTSVVLATSPDARDGRFRLAVDERLEAALRGELQRAEDLAPPRESAVTPREIQARLRTGESMEQIAADAGVDVARVARFGGPVFSERTQMIDSARAATLVRGRRGPSAVPLGVAVDERLARLSGLRADTVAWSTVRQGEGTWLVEVSYVVRGRAKTCRWRYDPHVRTVTAADPPSADLAHLEAVPDRPALHPPPATVVDPGPELLAAGRTPGVLAPTHRAPTRASDKDARATGSRTATAGGSSRTTAGRGARSASRTTAPIKVGSSRAAASTAVGTSARTASPAAVGKPAKTGAGRVPATTTRTAVKKSTRVPAKTPRPRGTVDDAGAAGVELPAAGPTTASIGPEPVALRVVPSVERPGVRPAPGHVPDAGQNDSPGPSGAVDPGDTATASSAAQVMQPSTRAVPAPGQIVRPARTGKRASVPAWADVLLSTSAREDDEPVTARTAEDDATPPARGRDGSRG